jgi:hypothetical protein
MCRHLHDSLHRAICCFYGQESAARSFLLTQDCLDYHGEAVDAEEEAGITEQIWDVKKHRKPHRLVQRGVSWRGKDGS